MTALLAALILAHGDGINTRLTVEREAEILCAVADEYHLDADQRKLLYVIRRLENGRPGFECGVEWSPASRNAADPARSVRTQALWAAGTIRRRYTGDLEAFSRRWCPANHVWWAATARQYMSMEATQ